MNFLRNHINHFHLFNYLPAIGKFLKRIPLLAIIIDEQLKVFIFLFTPKKFWKIREVILRINKQFNFENAYHRYGGIEFRWNNKEIAHMHSNGILDIYFPAPISTLLIKNRLTSKHHASHSYGWTSYRIKAVTDVDDCIQLINWSFQLHQKNTSVEEIIKQIQHQIKLTGHEK